MISVSFTGHRPDKLGGYNDEISPELNKFIKNWLWAVTDKIIQKFGAVNFISGGAQGVDLWAAEVVIEHKRNYKDKDIRLTMAIPCPEFGERWPSEAKEKLQNIIKQADKTVYVSSSYCGPITLHTRNEWMVNHSSIVIAVWDGSSGGTRNCFMYAKQMNKKIWRLDPKTCESIKY